MGPVVSHKQTEEPCADLTDVTLADEDTNSILTDNANGAIQGYLAMQVTQPDEKFGTNASGAILWPNLEPMQMAPSGGQIWN